MTIEGNIRKEVLRMRLFLKVISALSIVFTLVTMGACNSATSIPTTLSTDIPQVTATWPPTKRPTEKPTPIPTGTPTASPIPATPTPMPLSLQSAAFGPGEMIPKKYTRRGDDISPPLEWSDPPRGTQSLALIVYSSPLPDGGGNWVQWILFNIPAETRILVEGFPANDSGMITDGSEHFQNSWGEMKYGGPSPQHVETQRYYFILYALDTLLDLKSVEEAMREDGALPWIGASKAVLERAVEGHVLARGELVGRYKEE